MELSCCEKLSTLLRRLTSKHCGNFYCLNSVNSFRTENKLKSYGQICKNKDFFVTLMPSKKDNILEFNQYLKSDKMSYIIYADIEYLIGKIDGPTNHPKNSSTIKIWTHIPCGYSISSICGFDHIDNKHTFYREKDCIKKSGISLREHTKNIVDFEQKEMLPLTKEKLKSYQDTKACYICRKKIPKKVCSR